MINLPWWASIPKAELRAIQEQKIFKKGEYPKLDAIMEELEAQKDNLINDLVGHLNPEWSMDKKYPPKGVSLGREKYYYDTQTMYHRTLQKRTPNLLFSMVCLMCSCMLCHKKSPYKQNKMKLVS